MNQFSNSPFNTHTRMLLIRLGQKCAGCVCVCVFAKGSDGPNSQTLAIFCLCAWAAFVFTPRTTPKGGGGRSGGERPPPPYCLPLALAMCWHRCRTSAQASILSHEAQQWQGPGSACMYAIAFELTRKGLSLLHAQLCQMHRSSKKKKEKRWNTLTHVWSGATYYSKVLLHSERGY